MTPQEIYKAMTKGKWVVDPAGYSPLDFGLIDKQKYAGGAFVAGHTNSNFYELSTANTLAIVSAINGTFAQGIYPDKVGEMYAEFEKLINDRGFQNLYPKRSKELQALLTSAKINV